MKQVGVFLEFPSFLYYPVNAGNLIPDSSSFSKPSLDIWNFLVCIMLKPSMQDLKDDLTSMRDGAIVQWLAHSLVFFLGIGMRIDLFQSCGHCWVFQVCWHIECNTLMASAFRVLSSSTGILLHPLALIIAVLPKAHVTLLLRMPGSGWLTTPSWSSSSFGSFLHGFSVYSFHLFLISSVSSRSLLFMSFIVHIFGQNDPLVSPVLLKRSLVFPLLLFSSSFIHGSLEKAFLSLRAVLWKSAFSWIYLCLSPLLFTSLLPFAICEASSDNHFTFLLFFFFGMVLFAPPVQCHGPLTTVLQAQCLQVLIPRICSLPLLHIHRGFDLSHTWLA